VDDATSQTIDDSQFEVRVLFRVRKSETTTEQTVARVTLRKQSGTFRLLFPAIVVNHADYSDIVADVDIIHPDYELAPGKELLGGKISISAFLLMGDYRKIFGKDFREFRVKRKAVP
jgi:hypothetical protein